jgi:hypothetical protein
MPQCMAPRDKEAAGCAARLDLPPPATPSYDLASEAPRAAAVPQSSLATQMGFGLALTAALASAGMMGGRQNTGSGHLQQPAAAAAAAAEAATSWQAHAFALLDHDGDGDVSLSEAAEGYVTFGQQPGLWTTAGAGYDVSDLHDRWAFSCSRSAFSRKEHDQAGLVDCAAYGSRLKLLLRPGDSNSYEKTLLDFEEVLEWWHNPPDARPVTMTTPRPSPPPFAVGAAGGDLGDGTAPDSSPAWILISSDWHVEPWFAGDAFNTTQKWMRDGVARFANASLTNMMTCRDGSSGLHTMPCNLAGNKDPPIDHVATHFQAFQVRATN